MNFFKRAIKYSARQKLRSLLLFLTFTLLSTTILIALSSEKAVQQGTKQIKETVGAYTSFIYIKDRYLPKNSFTRMYGDLKICQKILVIFPRSFVNCEKR